MKVSGLFDAYGQRTIKTALKRAVFCCPNEA